MRVACAQYAVRDGDREYNLRRSEAAVRDAADRGVDLVVLPELANTGCDLDGREPATSLAEPIPDGPTARLWRKLAEDHGICIVGGVLERGEDALYNSAVSIGPDFLVCYRKTHLWDREKLLYKPGTELPVFDTPFGGIGVLVCYDAWFPEAVRTLALRGAGLICIPSNLPDDWVPENQRRGGLTMLNVHAISGANANRLFVAAANRVGDGYLGRSCIIDPTGGVLALAGATDEELIFAEVDLSRARREKSLTDLSHAHGDRNTGVYGATLQRAENNSAPGRI